ncbi:hypothetical protein DIPPA_06871 [Diplonema papillatum]|nr:hypothetical protein DIPPA_06871 [Diplonema papillatum]|eukprot:gene20187-31044_t
MELDDRNRRRAQLRSCANQGEETVAVALVPREAWQHIARLGGKHRHNIRCGPHVTLVDPLIADSLLPSLAREAAREIADAGVRPFEVVLREFGMFTHAGDRATVWLRPEVVDAPEDALASSQKLLHDLVPLCTASTVGKPFCPHVTVARFESTADARKAILAYQATWRPFSFVVDEFALLTRHRNDPYTVAALIPFPSSAPRAHALSPFCSLADTEVQAMLKAGGSKFSTQSVLPKRPSCVSSSGDHFDQILRTLRLCGSSSSLASPPPSVVSTEEVLNADGTPRDTTLWLFRDAAALYRYWLAALESHFSCHPADSDAARVAGVQHLRMCPLVFCAYPNAFGANDVTDLFDPFSFKPAPSGSEQVKKKKSKSRLQ